MKFQEFLESLKKELMSRLGANYTIKSNAVMKNNSVQLEGITILKEGENISPNIYVNDYFEQYLLGRKIYSIGTEILEIYENHKISQSLDMKFFENFKEIQHTIAFKLVNYERNETLLKSIPHIRFLDLAIVFYCLLQNNENGSISVLIYNRHLEMWNVKKELIYEFAIKNTPQLLTVELKEMEEVVEEAFIQECKSQYSRELCSQEIKEEEIEQLVSSLTPFKKKEKGNIPMYVLTNKSKVNGAACILYQDIMYHFASFMHNDVYILPSSVHEVILVPTNVMQTKEELEGIVKEVNETQVDREEVLSDKIYRYWLDTQSITLL